MKKPMAGAVVGVVMVLSLAGCSGQDRFAEAEKAEIPAPVAETLGEPVADSVRLLGQDQSGMTYYVGTWSTEGEDKDCFVAILNEQFASSCSTSMPMSLSFQGAHATLTTERIGEAEPGAETVGPYVTVVRS